MAQTSQTQIYEWINSQILKIIEETGQLPWVKPWHTSGVALLPKNAITDKEYRGANVFILSIVAGMKGYSSPYWLSFKQANELGGYVRKNEHPTQICFWNVKIIKGEPVEDCDDGDETEKRIPFLRYFNVFNADQCANLPAKFHPTAPAAPAVPKIAEVDQFVDHTKAHIMFGGDKAFYSPVLDFIQLPPVASFKGQEEFYSTELHELGHWTGHSSRLGRIKVSAVAGFGTEDYSLEELVAELTSAYLRAKFGIAKTQDIKNSAAYIKNWHQVLKNDPKMFIFAGQRAQKAVDYLLSLQ